MGKFIENQNCSKKCITSFLTSLNHTPSFFKKMESFVISSRKSINPLKLQSFIQELINKRTVYCEVGLYYTEKYIFNGIYQNTFFNENCGRNVFINNKVLLYSWIEMKHLEINIIDYETVFCIFEELEVNEKIEEIIEIFNSIEYMITCREKIDVLMETTRGIFSMLKENDGNDVFFPIFVFIILKSKVRNLLLHYRFIQKYKRKKFLDCKENCNHLVNIQKSSSCECFLGINNNIKEIDYYLTSFEAAIIFIERLEFDGLNIDKKEFEKKFSEHMSKIEFEKPYLILQKKGGWLKKIFKKIKNPF